jgi:hypothetical protein
MEQLSAGIQQGQETMRRFAYDIDTNLSLAEHTKTWQWSEKEQEEERSAK